MNEYVITFGQKYRREPHPTFPAAHPDGYVTVVAEDFEDCRRQTLAVLGRAWAFDYAPGELDVEKWAPLGELGRIENGVPSWTVA
jgi:hypothetical protein